jgi:hypothetical protein
MADFLFVGQDYSAASPTQDCEVSINWYPETDEMKSKGSVGLALPARGIIALYPTPGLVTLAQLITAQVRGMHVLPGGATMLCACGSNLYSISSTFVATVVGTLSSSTGQVYITDNGVGAYITDGTTRYSYIWGTNTFAIKTDGGFLNANVCDEVDNYIIYNYPNTSQWGCTNVGDVVSGGLNFASTLTSSNNLVALMADHRQILLMSEYTCERWSNIGSFPFPFAVIPGTTIQHGLAAQNSLAKSGNGVIYLGQDTRGNATVLMWGAGFSEPEPISNYAIENAIQGYAVTSDAIGYTYSQSGHEFYMLTFPTADVTWCYDIDTKMWHRRAWRDPATNKLHRHRSNCMAFFQGMIVVGDWQNGKLYSLTQDAYDDAGDPMPCIRRGPHMTSDLKRQFFSDLQIQFQPGVGLSTGQGSDPTCILRWSNDGGFTWGNDHILSIGKQGEYTKRAMVRRCGSARDRVFEIEVTDPVYRVVVSANINMMVGAN